MMKFDHLKVQTLSSPVYYPWWWSWLWSRYPIVIMIVSHPITRNCVNLFIGIIREYSWIPICMFFLLYNDDDLVLFSVTDVLDSIQFTVIKLKDLVEGENESLEWGLLLRGRIFKGVKIFIIRTSSGRRILDHQLSWRSTVGKFQSVKSNSWVHLQSNWLFRNPVQQFDRSLNISVINIFFLVAEFTCPYRLCIFHERTRKNNLEFKHASGKDVSGRKEFWSAGQWFTAAKQTSTAVRVRKLKNWFCSFGLVFPLILFLEMQSLHFKKVMTFWKILKRN